MKQTKSLDMQSNKFIWPSSTDRNIEAGKIYPI